MVMRIRDPCSPHSITIRYWMVYLSKTKQKGFFRWIWIYISLIHAKVFLLDTHWKNLKWIWIWGLECMLRFFLDGLRESRQLTSWWCILFGNLAVLVGFVSILCMVMMVISRNMDGLFHLNQFTHDPYKSDLVWWDFLRIHKFSEHPSYLDMSWRWINVHYS